MNKIKELIEFLDEIIVGRNEYVKRMGKDGIVKLTKIKGIVEQHETDVEYGGLIDALKVFMERGNELKVSEITDHLLMVIQALEWKQPPSGDDLTEEMVWISTEIGCLEVQIAVAKRDKRGIAIENSFIKRRDRMVKIYKLLEARQPDEDTAKWMDKVHELEIELAKLRGTQPNDKVVEEVNSLLLTCETWIPRHLRDKIRKLLKGKPEKRVTREEIKDGLFKLTVGVLLSDEHFERIFAWFESKGIMRRRND